MDDFGGSCGEKQFQGLTIGWIDSEDTLPTSRIGSVQESFPVAACLLVFWRRAIRSLRQSGQQLSDGSRCDVCEGSCATREHSPSSSRRKSGRGRPAVRTDSATHL